MRRVMSGNCSGAPFKHCPIGGVPSHNGPAEAETRGDGTRAPTAGSLEAVRVSCEDDIMEGGVDEEEEVEEED